MSTGVKRSLYDEFKDIERESHKTIGTRVLRNKKQDRTMDNNSRVRRDNDSGTRKDKINSQEGRSKDNEFVEVGNYTFECFKKTPLGIKRQKK